MKAHNLNDVRSTMSSSDFDLYVCKKLVAKERNARERGIEFGMTFCNAEYPSGQALFLYWH